MCTLILAPNVIIASKCHLFIWWLGLAAAYIACHNAWAVAGFFGQNPNADVDMCAIEVKLLHNIPYIGSQGAQ